MRTLVSAAVSALILVAATACSEPTQTKAPAEPGAKTLKVEPLNFTERTLANGLKVYALRDPNTANVSVQVWYDVGSKDDPIGRSGFAHLFEHIMFKATRNMPAETLDRLTEDVGGFNNASTFDDFTNYYQVVPAHTLETVLWAEADRMKGAVEGLARYWLGPNFPAFKTALDRAMTDVAENWAATAGSVMASVWTRGLALVNFFSLLLITPVVVFYLLVDWHPMLARLDGTLPRDHAPTVRRLAGDINDAVAAFIRGQGAICMMLGTYYAVGLSWAGIDYGLLVGITTGLLAFIPIVGWLLGLIFASGLAVVQFWPDLTPLAKVVGVLVAGLAFDAAVLSPRFVGQKVGLHPVWLIFALFVFSYLFGFVGTLVAVPLAAAVGVLVRFAVQVYFDSSVYKGTSEASSTEAESPRKDQA